MSDYIPIREAADEFNVDVSTLHRYIRPGRLGKFKRGLDRRTFVDRDELRRLLEFRTVSGGEGSRP